MTNSPRPANPFSTRFVRPAVSEYLFAGEDELSAIISRLEASRWRGQIIGPHGSGKTTLLHAVRGELASRGREIVLVELHDGQRRLPATTPPMASWHESTLVIVDGYEQLSWWSRRRLKGACRRLGCGLLVTAHTDVGLPLIYQTQPAAAIARQLVARLMADRPPVIGAEDVTEQFAACQGDIREMLFRLYDLFEQRTR